MRKTILFLLMLTGFSPMLRANEGFWLPLLLEQLNEADMRALGMKIKATDIYSLNQGSLKDAVAHFGAGGTGSLISGQGLLLAGYRNGLNAISTLATMENNYVEAGFWAKNRSEELVCRNLTATFIVTIEDVSKAALAGTTSLMTELQRRSRIEKNLEALKTSTKREPYQEIAIRSFSNGNQYILFVTETFTDIRLVGIPPQTSHYADTSQLALNLQNLAGSFSLFRIYADPNNHPAAYAPGNVPYRPKRFLHLSLNQVKASDFILSLDFPATSSTQQLAAWDDALINQVNPVRVKMRDQVLAVYQPAMKADPQIRLDWAVQITDMVSQKNRWIAQSQTWQQDSILANKHAEEVAFSERVLANPQWNKNYGSLLPEMDALINQVKPLAVSQAYFEELSIYTGLFRQASNFHEIIKKAATQGVPSVQAQIPELISRVESFFNGYREQLDRLVCLRLLNIYFQEVRTDHMAPYTREQYRLSRQDLTRMTMNLFSNTILLKKAELLQLLKTDPESAFLRIRTDATYIFISQLAYGHDELVTQPMNQLAERLNALQRQYWQAKTTVFPERKFYPDANGTLRVSYGKTGGVQSHSGETLPATLDLEQLLKKAPATESSAGLAGKLKALSERKDFGRYAVNGKIPACFLADLPFVEGCAGSPAIDAQGNLLGLAVDLYPGKAINEYHFDSKTSRTTFADNHLILFILDKIGGAGYLLQEMSLVAAKP